MDLMDPVPRICIVVDLMDPNPGSYNFVDPDSGSYNGVDPDPGGYNVVDPDPGSYNCCGSNGSGSKKLQCRRPRSKLLLWGGSGSKELKRCRSRSKQLLWFASGSRELLLCGFMIRFQGATVKPRTSEPSTECVECRPNNFSLFFLLFYLIVIV